eukprot:m.346710 g.346710  ORF g.346710 m.346710 type:complete len:767 (+) comp27915_c0_seq1:48-2348(+)
MQTKLKKAVSGIVDDIHSNDPKRQLKGTSKVSKLLRAPQRELEWESDLVIDAVVQTGAVERLASFLERYDDHKLQSEAANALANISAGTSENTCAVIKAGVVPIATRLLASSSSDLQDHAAWLLANIACESCSCVLEAGALPPLLKLLDESRQDTASEQSLVKTGCWLLSNLCQYTEDFEKVKGCLPRLAQLLQSHDEAVLKDSCWGLMYMCRLSTDAVIASGACEPLVKLLMHPSDDVCCVALEALSAIFSNGTLDHKFKLVEYNLFPRLRYLLHSRRERTREVACVTLANAMHGGSRLLPEIEETGVLLSLLHNIGRKSTTRDGWVTWREAVRTVCCIIDCAQTDVAAARVVRYLVGNGLVTLLSETIEDAALSNLDLYLDPGLTLVQHLIAVGEECAHEVVHQRVCRPTPNVARGGLAGSAAVMPAHSPSTAGEAKEVMENPYRSLIVECGLADKLSRPSVLRVWKMGFCKGTAPPLPEQYETLCMAVQTGCRLAPRRHCPTLKCLARAVVRQRLTYSDIRSAMLPRDVVAYVMGLELSDPHVDVAAENDIEATLALKDIGDQLFLSGKYSESASAYGRAITCIERANIEALLVILYLNRAAAYMKLGAFYKSIADCTSGLGISLDHPKCLQRRAMGYERAGLATAALQDYIRLKGEEAEANRARLTAELKLERDRPRIDVGSSTAVALRDDAPAPAASSSAPKAKGSSHTNGVRSKASGAHHASAKQRATVSSKHTDPGKPFSYASFKALRDITRTFLLEPA